MSDTAGGYYRTCQYRDFGLTTVFEISKMQFARCVEIAVALTVISLANSGAAEALSFNRVADSGRTTQMHRYASWDRNCQANGGVVKVLKKPAHGTLFSRDIASHINKSRTAGSTHCHGVPIKGFQVNYRSAAGFRGIDTFTIEVVFGNSRSDTDYFTVMVQ